MCWSVSDLSSHIALILDAESYDSVEKRFVEYPLSDVLQMQSLAKVNYNTPSGKSIDPKCALFCHSPRKDYFLKFMQEPLPVESSLQDNMHDHLISEIVSGSIESKQDAVDWITWTFMYRRLSLNPNYYNLAGKSA